jgi:hypothetical protein
VQTSPNSKFTRIKAIKKAQLKARDRQINEEDVKLDEDNASEMDCIIVEE